MPHARKGLLVHALLLLLWGMAWIAAICFLASTATGCALLTRDVRKLERTTTERVIFEDGSAIERSKTSAITVTKTPPTP